MYKTLSEGFNFSAIELSTLLSLIGFSDSRGLPLKVRQYDEEAVFGAINSLIRKKVIIPDSRGEEYSLAEGFKGAFHCMKDSDKAISLMSADFLAWGYICYPNTLHSEERKPIAIWQVDSYVKDKFTLYFEYPDEFCRLLFYDEFIPKTAVYCENISPRLNRLVEESIENMKHGNDAVGIKPRFTVRMLELADLSSRYLMVSRDNEGSYLSELSYGECKSVGYTEKELSDRLMLMLERGEWK